MSDDLTADEDSEESREVAKLTEAAAAIESGSSRLSHLFVIFFNNRIMNNFGLLFKYWNNIQIFILLLINYRF
jgi:hypothetical protein